VRRAWVRTCCPLGPFSFLSIEAEDILATGGDDGRYLYFTSVARMGKFGSWGRGRVSESGGVWGMGWLADSGSEGGFGYCCLLAMGLLTWSLSGYELSGLLGKAVVSDQGERRRERVHIVSIGAGSVDGTARGRKRERTVHRMASDGMGWDGMYIGSTMR
jgi:hypothetical protein